MNFKVGDIVKTRDGREVEILKTDAPGDYPIIGMLADDQGAHTILYNFDGTSYLSRCYDLLPPKRTREVTVWVNVLKHEGIEWAVSHDSYAVAKYSTTILDPRIEVLTVAVPCKIVVEY